MTDLSWLLSRSYSDTSALKLVGDRYRLVARQRQAVSRCACSDEALNDRQRRELPQEALRGAHIDVDGFNILTTIEVALSGGVLLVARDGCIRDIASVHGNYRVIEETQPAARLLLRTMERLNLEAATLYLDRPVSNSGRLAEAIRKEVEKLRGSVHFDIEVTAGVDEILKASPNVVASADSAILDRCKRWTNLTRATLRAEELSPLVVDLQTDSAAKHDKPARTAQSYRDH